MPSSIEKMTLKDIFARITEISIELSSMSYSQSDPGAMMDRRVLRKERADLEKQLAKLTEKKND